MTVVAARPRRFADARARTGARAVVVLIIAVAAIALAAPAALALGAQPGASAARKGDPDAGLRVRKWAYGPSVQQTATVTRDTKFPGRRPTVFFVHGGAWSAGSQASLADEARVWARQGWVVVNLDYRLKVKGSYMRADVLKVIQHFRAAAYVDTSRVILYGSSAGGHLATWIGSQLGSSVIKGVVAWSPVASPYNEWRTGTAKHATAEDIGLGEKARKFFSYDWKGTSALLYASAKKTPPMWIAGSVDDFVAWRTQGGALCAALGKKCTPHLMSGAGHGLGVATLHPELTQSARDWAAAVVGS
jgi:acetyl esterase